MKGVAKREADLLVLEAIASANEGQSGWLRANCPFCELMGEGSPDRHQSWGYHHDSGGWHCFRCKAKGRLHEGQNAVEPDPNEKPQAEFVEPPEGFIELASEEGRTAICLTRVRRYLRDRGLPWSTIEEARLGTAVAGKYANRVIVPVLSQSGNGWMGFLSRLALTKKELAAAEVEAAEQEPPGRILRYMNHPGEWRKGLLYNQRALYLETSEPCGVFEGVFSAFPAWPDCVACLGKPTEKQRDLLVAANRPLAICLDGDAWEEAEGLAQWLRFQGRHAGYVHFPPKTDANDVPLAWLRDEMRACIERPIT